MATLAQQPHVPAGVGDERFFLRGAIVMTVTIVAGIGATEFSKQSGRSEMQLAALHPGVTPDEVRATFGNFARKVANGRDDVQRAHPPG